MHAAALASGSSGNSFFVEANSKSFLIDAGISCKQIVDRMNLINRDVSDLNGIFITHEHIDHVRGVDVLARRYSIPVYVTKKCFENADLMISDESLVNFISKDEVLRFNGSKIIPFSKNHDAADPVSYSVVNDGKKVSVMTDIGIGCKNVVEHIKDSNLVFLESNHDVDMLQNGRYPYYLKKRISSDVGHLSNYDASLLVLEHCSPKLRHIVLSHLSENNNTEEMALKTFQEVLKHRKDLKNLNICVSSRFKPTDLFSI
ncbi:MAG: MBL fold metallo-hydrolase [Nanoarchaeota archaeon]